MKGIHGSYPPPTSEGPENSLFNESLTITSTYEEPFNNFIVLIWIKGSKTLLSKHLGLPRV